LQLYIKKKTNIDAVLESGAEKLVLFEIRWLLKGLQMMQLLSFSGGFVSFYALITFPMVVASIWISAFPRKFCKKLLRF